MGYTHYWKQSAPIAPEAWREIATRARRLVEASPAPLAREFDDPRRPVVGSATIRFNGVGRDGHETFLLRREERRGEFCKTARKPYDLVVAAVLLVVNKYAGDAVEVTSDGWREEWFAAKVFAERTLGESFELPPKLRDGGAYDGGLAHRDYIEGLRAILARHEVGPNGYGR